MTTMTSSEITRRLKRLSAERKAWLDRPPTRADLRAPLCMKARDELHEDWKRDRAAIAAAIRMIRSVGEEA